MLQFGGEADLALEPVGAKRRGQLREEHLDCDFAVVLDISREIHGRHPASPEFTQELVPASERGCQLRGESSFVGHEAKLGGCARGGKNRPARPGNQRDARVWSVPMMYGLMSSSSAGGHGRFFRPPLVSTQTMTR